MELLARFELATVSQRAYARREPSDLAIEKADEAASYAEVTKNLRIVLIRRKFGGAPLYLFIKIFTFRYL